MKPPTNFSKIIHRKWYSTETATLIAGDDFWDGHNFERHGRNEFLYRTPKGSYFTINLTQWENEQDTLTPVSQDEAIELYESSLSDHRVEYTEAFPGVTVEEA
jgi:hypothetical protein